MSERYKPDKDFTVEDLLNYNLGKHCSLITTIYQTAQAEYAVEQKLAKLKKLWDERCFKLAKHICESVYNTDKMGMIFIVNL